MQITESFKLQHENLNIKEKELKEDLIKKATEAKQNLENNLIISNEIIKNNENIEKIIKYFEKNNINKIIRTISYISEIEKNNYNSNEFLEKIITNINIYYNKNDNRLQYSNYTFNGLLEPININIKNANYNNSKIVSWNIDENEKLMKDINKYRFNIEINEGQNNYIFEGKETQVEIRNLDTNKEYKVRVCSFYEGVYSNWSEFYKIDFLDENNFGKPFYSYSNSNLFFQKNDNYLEVFGIENNNYNNNSNKSNIKSNSIFGNISANNQNDRNFIPWKKIN